MLTITRYSVPPIGSLLFLLVLSNSSFFIFLCVLLIFLVCLSIFEWNHTAILLKAIWKSTLPVIHEYALKFPDANDELDIIQELSQKSSSIFFIITKTSLLVSLLGRTSKQVDPDKEKYRREILEQLNLIHSSYLKVFFFYGYALLVFVAICFLKLKYFS